MSNDNLKPKKGVNLNDFFAKQGAKLIKNEAQKNIVPKKEAVAPVVIASSVPAVKKEDKKVAVVKEKKVKESKKQQKKADKEDKKSAPQTPPDDVPKMFQHVRADTIKKKEELLIFIKWYAIPFDFREPKREEDLAKKLGVNRDVFTDWKKLVGFADEVAIYRNDAFRVLFTTKVYYKGIVKPSLEGSFKAAELFAKLFEGFNEKIKVVDETPKELDEEQTARINHALKNIGLAAILEANAPDEESTPHNDNSA